MNPNDKNQSNAQSSEAHWSCSDPASQPDRAQVLGLPRMVLETRTRLGGNVTPEQVTDELRSCGMDVDIEAVREVWDEGHQDDRP